MRQTLIWEDEEDIKEFRNPAEHIRKLRERRLIWDD